jgi:hypothetical protein
MSFRPSLLILIFLSLLTGFLLAAVAAVLMPSGTGGAYAALILDESWPDRKIRELLDDETVISEASQWVFLDDFNGLTRIPLDEYRDRVLSFDPRNDGYAERLRSFFVRDGKRLFFIPLGRDFWGGGTGKFEKRLAASLGDIPFEIEYTGRRKPVWLYAVFFAGAAIGSILLSRRLALIFCMPVLAGFSFAGPPGLALAAVFTGLGSLLLAPGGEYFMFRRYRKAKFGYGNSESRTLGDIMGPFRACWLLTPVFLAALVFITLTGKVHPLLALGEGAGFTGIFLFSLRTLSRRGASQGHIRFAPVLIRPVPVKNPVFSRVMLPFAFFSLLSALLPPVFPGLSPAGNAAFLGEQYPVPGETEYRAHAAFQSSFSYRALGSGGLGEPSYFRYDLGDDGLISGKTAYFPPEEEIPPFPLEELMRFTGTGGGVSPEGRGFFTPMDLAPVFVILLFSVPAFIRPARGDKKKKNWLIYKHKEKGIAA